MNGNEDGAGDDDDKDDDVMAEELREATETRSSVIPITE